MAAIDHSEKQVAYRGDPVADRLTKRTIPEYGPLLSSPNFFSIHIMFYQTQKADRPAIRETDHPVSVSNHKSTKKRTTPTHSLIGEIYARKGPVAS